MPGGYATPRPMPATNEYSGRCAVGVVDIFTNNSVAEMLQSLHFQIIRDGYGCIIIAKCFVIIIHKLLQGKVINRCLFLKINSKVCPVATPKVNSCSYL